MHRFQAAIISRIKILANLNIAERRVPQDGRIKFQVGGRQIDVRVSVIPMLFGEGVVMRLLDKANVLFSLQELGMDEETYERFQGPASIVRTASFSSPARPAAAKPRRFTRR